LTRNRLHAGASNPRVNPIGPCPHGRSRRMTLRRRGDPPADRVLEGARGSANRRTGLGPGGSGPKAGREARGAAWGTGVPRRGVPVG
jgi:hypothetical protein